MTREKGQVVGYFAVGPMKAVCLEDAADADEAERVLSRFGTVLDVWELVEGQDNPPGGETSCAICGRVILTEA